MINFINPQRFVAIATNVALAGSGTITLGGTGTLSTTENVALSGSGTITLGGTGTISTTENVALSGSGTIALGGTGTLSTTENVALSGSGTIALGGTGTLSTTENVALAGSGTIALGGTGTLSTTENLALSGSGTIALGGTGTLSTTENLALSGSGTIALGGTGTLSTTENVALSGSGTIALGGTGTINVAENVALSGSGTIALGGTGSIDVYTANESTVINLSGKLCWFDANDITGSSNGDALSSWPSRHDSGVSASNSTSSTQPIYNTNQVNSLPAVNFDADYLEVNYGSNTSQPLTAFIVCAYDVTSGGGSNNALDGRDNPSGYRAVNFSMRTNGWGSYAGSSWMQPSTGSPDTDWHYFTVYLNGASSYVRKDGVSHATGNPGSQGTNGQILGMWKGKNTSYYMNGKIAEILIFSGTLSDANRNTTESYLADKYNI